MTAHNGIARLLAAGIFLPALFWAQGLSTINGSVADPSGAVVAGAKVTATEADTNVSRNTVSNSEGLYVFDSLRPTAYRLTIEAPGFRSMSRTGITLQANDAVTLNFKLELGAANEVVSVEGSAAQVDTTTATVRQVVDASRVVDLPLNGRNPAQLTTLVAGAVIAPSDDANEGVTKTFPVAITVSTNGGRSNQVSYFLDGVPNIDFLSNVNLPFPMPDALQEFSVQTSNYSAEFGENNGAVVNIITKNGTNIFHGDAFEYIRNSAFNARNFFASAVDPLKRNQFGGTIGGPIVKDKLFFFFGYEGTRLRDVTNGLSAYVPTATDLTGDFSALLSASNPNNPLGRAVTVKDPTTGQPFPNNQIDPGRFDRATLNMLTWLPSATGNGHVFYNEPLINNLNEYTTKEDYELRASDRLAFRYFNDSFDQPAVLANHNLLTYSDYAEYVSQNAAVEETHIFKPTLLNEFRFGVERETDRRGPPSNTPTVAQFGSNITQGSVAAIEGITTSGFFNFGSFPQGQFPRVGFSWSDTVRYQVGRHSIAFGGSYERDRLNEFTATNSNGVFSFAGNITGSALTDLMLGRMQTFTQGNGYVQANRYNLYSLFAQDTFKATKRLSLDLGIRWEPSFPWHDLYHEAEVFFPAMYAAGIRSTVYPNAPPGEFFPGDPGVPADGRRKDWLNFGPRIGFAYDVFGDGKTSIRGGAGIFYNSRVPGFANNRQSQSTPFSLAVTLTQPQGPFSNPYLGVPNPFPAPLPPPKNTVFPSPVLVYSWNPGDSHLSPTTYGGNLTIEHQLPGDWLIRGAYVFTRTTHLNVNEEINPAVYNPNSTATTDGPRVYSGYSTIFLPSSAGNSWYNSMQLTAQKRLSHGFTILGNYTWSKSIDDIPNGIDAVTPDVGTTFVIPATMPHFNMLDRGPSEFDYEHHFSGSYVWQLPALAGANGFERAVLGGWDFSGILTLQTGGPLTIAAGQDRSLTGDGYDRAVEVNQGVYRSGPCANTAPCVQFLNPSAFALPPYGTFGTLGKGTFRGPGIFNWDMSMTKQFVIGERVNIQYRLEYFNIFNHPNFNNPASSFAGAGFGNITGAADPRIAQMALKVVF